MSRPSLPDKLFFRIGEVAEIVGVKPHVLRYWEEELGVLRPMKTRGSHRQYRRRDVEIALVVRELLQEEGFTLAGAKKRLREMGMADALRDTTRTKSAARQLEVRAELLALRQELVALRDGLEQGPPRSATTHVGSITAPHGDAHVDLHADDRAAASAAPALLPVRPASRREPR